MKIERLAAIDVGSNAIRLLVSNIIFSKSGSYTIKKSSLIRTPIRLGKDAFTKKRIGKRNTKRLLSAMNGFRNMMDALDVKDYRACATSAMREADNGDEIVQAIKDQSDIEIEIIDGKEEADILYNTQIAQLLKRDKAYFYIDVGGGSTEITIFYNDTVIDAESFKVGTVRMLNNKVTKKTWTDLSKWLRKHSKSLDNKTIIGSGGNINKLHKMSRQRPTEALHIEYLRYFKNYISSFSYDERILDLNLNPDRADVIIPAIDIFSFIMEKSGISEVYVPKIGIADGIIKLLAKEHYD